MKQIVLTQGKVALVDDGDFNYLNQWSWYYNAKKGYACATINKKTVYMHRLIMKTPSGKLTDHKDQDKLNNQKFNLRICTSEQNNRNTPKISNKKSKYKGVVEQIDGRTGKRNYVARIYVNKKSIVKYFPFTPEGEIAAARAYNILAQQHFKEFAGLNSILRS